METVRLTIVSDSHLSPRTPEATTNWDALVSHVDQTRPDAVVHTGDVTLDGTSNDEELRFARVQLDKMPVPILTLPGNHDLGDNPCETNAGSTHLVSSQRVSTYREIIGDDRWATDIGRWRLVGFNAQLLESGLDEEEEQWEWLERELQPDRFADRYPAIFLHKPMLHSDPQPAEHDEPARYIRPRSRQRLFSMFAAISARVAVSGHVHQFRHFEAAAMQHIWAPTTWATIPPDIQATIGDRWVGGLDLELGEDGVAAVATVQPGGVGQHVIGETIPNPYRK